MGVDMSNEHLADGDGLSAEELHAEELSELPRREAMSVISGTSSPLPIEGADQLPTTSSYQMPDGTDNTISSATSSAQSSTPPLDTSTGEGTVSSQDQTVQTSSSATDSDMS